MRTDITILIVSSSLFFAGLWTARAQSGLGYYCDGPIYGCTNAYCNPYSSSCLDDLGDVVDYNYYGQTGYYYDSCAPQPNNCCPTPSKATICDVSYYELPQGEGVCLAKYRVCTSASTVNDCPSTGPPCN